MIVPVASIVAVAVLGAAALLIGIGWYVRSLRARRRDEWNQGRRQVAKDFSSIWDEQQRRFQQTVRDFEHEINRRMVDAAQASQTQSDPLLVEFDELMKKHKDGGPPPPPLKEREFGGPGKP